MINFKVLSFMFIFLQFFQIVESLTQQNDGRVKKENQTASCIDSCFEELSTFTNELRSNTTITINRDFTVHFRVDPKDFQQFCPIYRRSAKCLKNCSEDTAKKLFTSFGPITYLCIDGYQEALKNFGCLDKAIVENPQLDTCVTSCLVNSTKNEKLPKNSSDFRRDCSSLICLTKCSLTLVKQNCDENAAEFSRKFIKVQLDTVEKTEGANGTWPLDCVQLKRDVINKKFLFI